MPVGALIFILIFADLLFEFVAYFILLDNVADVKHTLSFSYCRHHSSMNLFGVIITHILKIIIFTIPSIVYFIYWITHVKIK